MYLRNIILLVMLSAFLVNCAYDPLMDNSTTIFMQDNSGYYDSLITNVFTEDQMVAAEWDDLEHWNDWLELLSDTNSSWSSFQDYWGFNTFQKVSVRVTDGSTLVGDMQILLVNPLKQVVWSTRTDLDGFAHLYINATASYAGPFHIKATQGSNIQFISNVTTTGSSYQPLSLSWSSTVSNSADILFCLDTTGSMGDELAYLQDKMEEIMSTLKNRFSDILFRWSGSYYRDIGSDYVISSFPFTTNRSQFIAQLNAHSAGEGGDYPESVDIALTNAVFAYQWSESARTRLIFLVLDAPPHYTSDALSRLRSAVKEAAAKGIRIIPIVTSHVKDETEALMRLMAVCTGGRFVFLFDDQGSSLQIPSVEDYEAEYLDEAIVRIVSEYLE